MKKWLLAQLPLLLILGLGCAYYAYFGFAGNPGHDGLSIKPVTAKR